MDGPPLLVFVLFFILAVLIIIEPRPPWGRA